MRLGQGDAVVVGQLLAGLDRADRLDEHPVAGAVVAVVFLEHGLAVRRAAVVDPARDVAVEVGVDHVLVVEREQERVARVGVAAVAGVDVGVGATAAAVLDQALALGDGFDGEHAVAVDGGATGDDLARHAACSGEMDRHCDRRAVVDQRLATPHAREPAATARRHVDRGAHPPG